MDTENIVPVYDENKVNSLHVTQGNKLIRFKKEPLSLLESRLVRYIIAQISMNDSLLLSYKINANQLADALGIDRHNVYPVFRELSASMATKFVHVEKGISKSGKTVYDDVPWFGSIGYDEDDNVVLQLNSKLEEYVLSLKAFTDYKFEDILKFHTDNCIKLYELIVSWKSKPCKNADYTMYGRKLKGNEIIFSMDFLRTYFGCEDKYKKTSDFVKRVIEPNVREINENVFGVKYRPYKVEKKIVAIIFTLGY